jgi:hypothetical protein
VLPVGWREVEFGSRARAGRGSCWDGSRILDLILPLLDSAWGKCWELEMEGCMFDLLEGNGNGFETWVLRCWFGDRRLGVGAVGPLCVVGWSLCFDNHQSLGILRLSYYSILFSENVLLKRSRRDDF